MSRGVAEGPERSPQKVREALLLALFRLRLKRIEGEEGPIQLKPAVMMESSSPARPVRWRIFSATLLVASRTA